MIVTQAPEPPPPRRSGELRREASTRSSMGPPPPVKRAEKPKFLTRPQLQTNGGSSPAVVLPKSFEEQTSPFDSPPRSRPIVSHDAFKTPVLRPRPVTMDFQSRANTGELSFGPPPIHQSVINNRSDADIGRPGRNGASSANVLGDAPELRPALPARNNATPPSRPKMSLDIPRRNPALSSSPDIRFGSRSEVSMSKSSENDQFIMPPKRIFSTPLSAKKSPPRTHGRSLTVDSGDRTPKDVRRGGKTQDAPSDVQRMNISAQAQDGSQGDHYLPNVTQYPDPSHSNRRPPYIKQGVREIPTRYDTRIFAVCGEYVCTSGSFTRVWNLQDGEQIMSLAHGDTIKITSLAFKPAANIKDEGNRIWLGNNVGELLEIDIPSQSLLMTKTAAHARREVVKIHRHMSELWTLDDAGTLHVWGPGKSNTPSLEDIPQSYRVPKGHTFSMTVGDELWHVVGKEIRVFVPTYDGNAQFQVLQSPLCQQNAGEISAGTATDSHSDRVYFGHNDGKVSIYSRIDYACLGTVNVSLYKINCLASVGDYLWAGYNSGMLHVYDTSQAPWLVVKTWHAHGNPVVNVLSDQSSFWKLDRLQVVSFGADNVLRSWDGLLQDDWLGEYLIWFRSLLDHF